LLDKLYKDYFCNMYTLSGPPHLQGPGWPDWANFRILGDCFSEITEEAPNFGATFFHDKTMYYISFDKRWTGLHTYIFGDFSHSNLVTLARTRIIGLTCFCNPFARKIELETFKGGRYFSFWIFFPAKHHMRPHFVWRLNSFSNSSMCLHFDPNFFSWIEFEMCKIYRVFWG
jgi:hypothetical protein